MKERLSPVKINGYDSQGPEVNTLASICFEDPGNSDCLYCVCFEFNGVDGDDLTNPHLWKYHHANHWTPKTLNDDSRDENHVRERTVSKILKLHGQSIDSLSENYCTLLSKSKN